MLDNALVPNCEAPDDNASLSVCLQKFCFLTTPHAPELQIYQKMLTLSSLSSHSSVTWLHVKISHTVVHEWSNKEWKLDKSGSSHTNSDKLRH